MRRALCFCAGLVLALMMVLISIAGPAMSTGLFVRALKAEVNRAAANVTEEQLEAFGTETMRYLKFQKEHWEPEIPVQGIAPSFREHMAEVRHWADVLKTALPVCALLAVCGLFAGRRSMLHGVLVMLGLLLALLLWAAVDFLSLWRLIHLVFIPGGIFPAGEAIMQLFPLSLFFSYVGPAAGWMAAGFAALFAALFLYRSCKG
jgi:hypothetical protein